MAKRVISGYTLAHFCVDFACLYAFFALFVPGGASAALGALVYNGLAFGLQPFIGVVCDGRRFPTGLLGCCLLALGLALGGVIPWPGLVLCALGNACFHVGGGSECLAASGGNMAGNGVFVASGALGVALGTLAGRAAMPLWLPLGMVALCAALVWRLPGRETGRLKPFGATSGRAAGAVIALCALSILVRSYGGVIVPMPWKTGPWLALTPAVAAFGGKAAGGFLADRFGARRVGAASLLAAAVLLGLFSGNTLLCLLGLFCFNLCMPITLCAIADKLPHNPGLAFGVTTLGLFVGWLPSALWGAPAEAGLWVAGLSALSALCLYFATARKKEA